MKVLDDCIIKMYLDVFSDWIYHCECTSHWFKENMLGTVNVIVVTLIISICPAWRIPEGFSHLYRRWANHGHPSLDYWDVHPQTKPVRSCRIFGPKKVYQTYFWSWNPWMICVLLLFLYNHLGLIWDYYTIQGCAPQLWVGLYTIESIDMSPINHIYWSTWHQLR